MPANLGQDFYPKLVQMTSEVGMNPEDLLAIMVSESGINPGVGKSGNTAAGLIRFMPFILPGVGFLKALPIGFAICQEKINFHSSSVILPTRLSIMAALFKSAAQYYVANFYRPVALKLPGVQRQIQPPPLSRLIPPSLPTHRLTEIFPPSIINWGFIFRHKKKPRRIKIIPSSMVQFQAPLPLETWKNK